MQSSPVQISPQVSHVSFSNIEEKHQFPIERSESTKINQQMKRELKLWDDLFIDLIEMLTKATPYPPIYIQNNDDKRFILRQLCEIVVNKAANPTESTEYQTLEKNLFECQKKVEELKIRCQQISDQLASAPQETPVMKEKETLEQKLSKLEEILKRQVKNRKNELLKEKNKIHKKKKSSDQVSDSSVYKSIKSRTSSENEPAIPTPPTSSFKFENIPISRQSSKNKSTISQSNLVTDYDNDASNESSG